MPETVQDDEGLDEAIQDLGEAVGRVEGLGDQLLRNAQARQDLERRLDKLEANLRWMNDALRSLLDAEAGQGGWRPCLRH